MPTATAPTASSSQLPLTTPLSLRAQASADQAISYLMQKALAHPELISLAAGFVDQESLPVAAAREAMEAVLANPARARAAMQYGTTPGYLPLREALLARFLADDQANLAESNLTVDQVVLSAGSNQLLHLVSECLFEPDDIVLCSWPTYFVYLSVLKTLGVRPVGVEMDAEGMIPDDLSARLERLAQQGELSRVKAIYVVSYYDNPAAVTLSLARRPQVVEIAERFSRRAGHRIRVLEDAAYRELRYAGDDLPSLRAFDPQGDTVIVAQTFSKSFSPGVRVGWGFLPRDLVQPVCGLKGVVDFGSPNFAQHVMAQVLESGRYEPHVRTLRDAYRTKLNAILQAADEHLAGIPGVHWLRPTGGLYAWLTLPAHIDTSLRGPLFGLAMEEGMLYVPGEYCYPSSDLDGRAAPRNTIRLSFGVQSPERIAAGMTALGRAIRRLPA